jgi:pimeloyl-ACP methyl ester carboxylesterase
VVRFDFRGWGRSDKPRGYAYTATNHVGDLAAVVAAIDEHLDANQVTLVAHAASGPPVTRLVRLSNPGAPAGGRFNFQARRPVWS